MQHKVKAWCKEVKAEFIGNGVDQIKFPFLEEKQESNPLSVGIFGEVKSKKGLEILLSALDFERFVLRIVGRLSEDSAKMLHGFLTLHPEYSSKVQIVPYVKKHLELLEQYRQVDIVCIPSLHDGMPNVLLEAMSCGKIVVASEVGGALDVIKARKNGFLFSRGNAQSLADELKYVSSLSAEQRQQVKNNARETIVAEFSWELERKHYLKIFSQI
jgi:glycosyltransferase involved in cell wall biosynthesis